MKNVLAVADTRDGGVLGVSRETVGVASGLAEKWGGSVDAMVPGATEGEVALGADRVLRMPLSKEAAANPDLVAGAVAGQLRGHGYSAVVFAATARGRDLAPRVAARLGVPLATDVIAASVEGDDVVVRRPVYAGKAIARVRMLARPALISIRPNVFGRAPSVAPSSADALAASADVGAGRYRVLGFEASRDVALDVAEAEIIVSGGRGMQGPDHWHLLAELRDALGETAALGASRAVVDAGWRPHAEQVGQTGKTVTPKLYFAVAISGAIQHLAGMRTASVIVAVNRDAEAPIFGVADYGIVGDAFEILPELAKAIRELRDS